MFRTKDLIEYIRQHPRKILFGLVGLTILGLIVIAANYIWIGRYDTYMTTSVDSLSSVNPPVGIVFGGGVLNGKPRPLLRDRLDAATRLLEAGKVRKLLLSGDNRFVNYDEPQAMKDYLVHEKHIGPNKLQVDDAGRSTYETCERAKKTFGLDRAILVSESTHLPRAIYTCRSFGIEATGLSSDGQSSAGLKVGQRFREVLARTKATINIYIIGEPTVLGDKIPL
jgi:vancomycin permeability regulator SanA